MVAIEIVLMSVLVLVDVLSVLVKMAIVILMNMVSSWKKSCADELARSDLVQL